MTEYGKLRVNEIRRLVEDAAREQARGTQEHHPSPGDRGNDGAG